ncbi:MAG: TlyA family RNA methyltransferase [Candidatus Adiutrix intracellularis]|jgi:23S rRNA (cytidine1920-2'-O)/16S rRNA (cytidine1409-2'-O)-methyltransferase|nr:TlyA family RNA methyltransferase [Candidatus Adiutrix intracellularis]
MLIDYAKKILTRKRADELLTEAGLAQSRSQAQALIMAGGVRARDRPVLKAGEKLPDGTVFTLTPRRRFVSRGGLKLEGALQDLGLDPAGLVALDVGASTGGFTDCLLQYGAVRVMAVDVGRNLIDSRLRADPRVTLVEGLNARRLATELSSQSFDLITMDVSFISLELVLPQAACLLRPEGWLLALVKPQFEVGRAQVGKKGVVRDPAAIKAAVDKISALGLFLTPPRSEAGRAPSRLAGPAGNQEVFILFRLAAVAVD